MVSDKPWYQIDGQKDIHKFAGSFCDCGGGFQKFDYLRSVFVPCLAGGYHLHKKGKKAILKRFIPLKNL